MAELKYLGHSCFFIDDGKDRILIDPFLTGNPLAGAKAGDLFPTLILVTHGHGDHLGDAIAISKRTGAPILGVFELVNYCIERGAKGIPAHIGGKIKFDFGWVKLLQANHSSSTSDGVYTGNPVGFIVDHYGNHIYHAGDTGLFGDMEMFGRIYRVDIALLPIGGTFVMDVLDAVDAVKMLKCRVAIPMHYDTFPPIKADVNRFKNLVEKDTDTEVVTLKPGETFELKKPLKPC